MAGIDAMGAIVRNMSGPFEWGPNDCSSAAFLAFNEMWGVNPLDSFPEYRGLRGAAEFIRDNGGRDGCYGHVMSRAGLVRCEPHEGALCASYMTPRRWSLGIYISENKVAFKTKSGFTVTSPAKRSEYWGVSWR
jgi:hypothetical protein